MEQQALGRVYRMGQEKVTYFVRIMVKNSIDERLAQLQLDKLEIIAKAIQESDSSKFTLSDEEIVSLFGRVVRDEFGRVINVEADYDDETDKEKGGEEKVWAEGADEGESNLGNWDPWLDESSESDPESP
jgi:hypothetical protein